MPNEENSTDNHPAPNTVFNRYKWRFYLGAAVILTITLVIAEQLSGWYIAQACAIVILLLTLTLVWSCIRSAVQTVEPESDEALYDRAMGRLIICILAGYFALIMIAIRHDRWVCGIAARAFGYDTMVAGACLLCGILLGLLFGFRPTGPAHANGTGGSEKDVLKHPRTNLEEIADWLTKVILGAGLVGLTKIVGLLPRFGRFMAKGVEPELPAGSPCLVNPASAQHVSASLHLLRISSATWVNPASAQSASTSHQLTKINSPIALAVVFFFLASGVLYGYLWSRWEFALAHHKPKATPSSQGKPETPKQ